MSLLLEVLTFVAIAAAARLKPGLAPAGSLDVVASSAKIGIAMIDAQKR